MKPNTRIQIAVYLQALVLMIVPCRGAPAAGCEVAVAALTMPGNSTGKVHWRATDAATKPLQLSTRYFSGRLKVPENIIRFYENPVAAGQEDPLPVPFLTVRIPPEIKLAYIVLRSEAGENGQSRWQASLISGNEWKAGCLKIHNACPETIGISAGKKLLKVPRGKSLNFHFHQWKESFPVKIYWLQPKTKLVFSSTWRVAAARRELCFIGMAGKSVKLRSLIEFGIPPPEPD